MGQYIVATPENAADYLILCLPQVVSPRAVGSNQLSYGAISLTPSGDANYYSGIKTVCQCLLTKKLENLSAKSQRGYLDNLAWGWYTSKVPTYAGVLELADETDSKSCSSIHRRFCRTLGITAYFQLNNSIWF